MTDTPISPLRRRMIEDMTVRKFAARTQDGYIRAVKGFSTFLGTSPATASAEDLRRYRLHLVECGVGAPTINHSLTALRFLFLVTLRKPAIVLDMPFVREPRRLPVVLSPQEVARLLDAAPGLKYKAALSIAYGAGCGRLRSSRSRSPTSTAPGWSFGSNRARAARTATSCCPSTCSNCCAWWKAGRPQGWLFPGQNPVNPLTPRQLNRVGLMRGGFAIGSNPAVPRLAQSGGRSQRFCRPSCDR
jgi:integrase/recombinase XerD